MLNILHIEDDENTVEYIKHHYSGKFKSITSVSFLRDGIRLLESIQDFDFILLDLNLPDSLGVESIKNLTRFNIPIVVLTGSPTMYLTKALADIGVVDYITKDYLMGIDLLARLEFLHSKVKAKKINSFDFVGFDEIKPLISVSGSKPSFPVDKK